MYVAVSIDSEWSDPSDIPSDVKKEYHDFLRKINAHRVSRKNKTLWVCVWSFGLAGDGDYKGYIYKPDGIKHLVESLDNFSPPGKAILLLREIGDGWYLYYDHIP